MLLRNKIDMAIQIYKYLYIYIYNNMAISILFRNSILVLRPLLEIFQSQSCYESTIENWPPGGARGQYNNLISKMKNMTWARMANMFAIDLAYFMGPIPLPYWLWLSHSLPGTGRGGHLTVWWPPPSPAKPVVPQKVWRSAYRRRRLSDCKQWIQVFWSYRGS